MGATTGAVSVRPMAPRSWPPTAHRESIELSVPAVIAILVGASLLDLLVFAAADAGVPAGSPFHSPIHVVTRALVVPSAVTLGVSMAVVLLLGWERASGLGLGSASPWGLVPFTILAVASIATLALPNVSSTDPVIVGLVLLGLLLAALTEEVLFRGYLQHGLTRRIGGRRAVLCGSALFAAAHLPSLILYPTPGGLSGLALLMLFGFGVLMCRIRTATGSIWLATGVHTLHNFVTVAVLGSVADPEDASPLFGLGKLTFVAVGLVIAVRLGRAPDSKDPVPPMPVLSVPVARASLQLPPPPVRTGP